MPQKHFHEPQLIVTGIDFIVLNVPSGACSELLNELALAFSAINASAEPSLHNAFDHFAIIGVWFDTALTFANWDEHDAFKWFFNKIIKNAIANFNAKQHAQTFVSQVRCIRDPI